MNKEKRTSLAKVNVKAKTILLQPLLFLLTIVLAVSSFAGCSNSAEGKTSSKPLQPARAAIVSAQSSGSIYLYGEAHGVAKILDREFEVWSDYYHNKGMRHLFVELPYFTAEYLNMWMQSDNDDILDEIYEDWKGSPDYNPDTKNFYKQIKSECPETIFHGTDVGHQYDSTGRRFLAYLEANGLTGSKEHILTKGSIQQGRLNNKNDDKEYRENKMTENFIREMDKLGSESVMGIYGSAHTVLDGIAYGTDSLPCMANQLRERYGEEIFSENLSWMTKDIEPYRVDYITLEGEEYTASYFGKQDLTGFKDYTYREFWRLENAYEDVKTLPLVENYLPYDNYPMLLETGQVFVIDCYKTDGSVEREYYLSSGQVWDGLSSTQQFTAD